jgi:hypothetical protein
MTTRTLLLTLHIAAVSGWLGANYLQLALSARFAEEPAGSAAAWTRQTMWLGQRYYVVMGAIIPITGVLLVLDGDWSWSSGFIWVGVAAVVIGAAMGATVFARLAQQRVDALERGDQAGAAAVLSRTVGFAVLDTLIVLTAVMAMVHKWKVG